MGIVWEASHKGVPLLGVPENPIDNMEKTHRGKRHHYIQMVVQPTRKNGNPQGNPWTHP